MRMTTQKVVTTLAPILLLLLLPGFGKGQEKSFDLSKGKAGRLEIGMTIDDLYQSVGKQNTKLVDAYSEGYFSPIIEIYPVQGPAEKPALRAEVVGKCPASNEKATINYTFVVGRISVNDPQFKTSLGIGVGSTLGEIRQRYKVDWITFGEGPLVARVEDVGMSFALDYASPPEAWYTTHDPALIPDSARVTSILLTLLPAAIASQPQRLN
jgi:hypothetical protein